MSFGSERDSSVIVAYIQQTKLVYLLISRFRKSCIAKRAEFATRIPAYLLQQPIYKANRAVTAVKKV
jgi:hypothetical protein